MQRSFAMFDYLVFIGRFQPFHNGHMNVVKKALTLSKKVIIAIGSSQVARTFRNPWTYEERVGMILSAFEEHDRKQLLFISVLDIPTNDQLWVAQVQTKVADIVHSKAAKIGIIGMEKDHTSFYLRMFPTWDSVMVEQEYIFNSTDIRNDYFKNNPHVPRDNVPDSTTFFLKQFLIKPEFVTLVHEHEAIKAYKKSWSNTPYPVIFVTVDAVVVQSGHVLLVRRGDYPGKGLLALPGGFLNVNERLRDAVVRELKEETRIKDHIGEIPPAKLRSFIEAERIFDDPNRSARGRTITNAFLFKLPDSKPLYEVQGGDDAESAHWHQLGTLKPEEFFEDHKNIIDEMTAGIHK